jgi:hypothetical protein
MINEGLLNGSDIFPEGLLRNDMNDSERVAMIFVAWRVYLVAHA